MTEKNNQENETQTQDDVKEQQDTETQNDGKEQQEADKKTLLGGQKDEQAKDEQAKDEQAKDGQKEDEDKPDNAEVPEKYELKLPDEVEGVELDEVMVEEFTPVFKELGLTNEQAQELTNKYAHYQAQAFTKQLEAWKQETLKDSEIGGDKIDETIHKAELALEKLGDDDLRQTLEATGLGNYRGIIKLLAKVGDLVADDSTAGSSSATNNKVEAQNYFETLYKG